jgi:hypothetical protein
MRFTGYFCLMVMAATVASCRPRTFTDSNSYQSGTEQSIEEYAEKLQMELFDAGKRASGVFSENDLSSFFDEYMREAIKLDSLARFKIYPRAPWSIAIKRAVVEPIWLTKHGAGSIPDGGLVLIGKHIFPEGYFRTSSKNISLQELMTAAPWFEWIEQSQRFEPRKGGGQKVLIQSFYKMRGSGRTFTVFRGTGSVESGTRKGNLDPYLSGKPEPDSLRYFSSPSLNTAVLWSSPIVMKAEIPRDVLLQEATSEFPTVYVGIEYAYPEFAFLATSKRVPVYLSDSKPEPFCVSRRKIDAESEYEAAAAAALSKGATYCAENIAGGFYSGFGENPRLSKKGRSLKPLIFKSAAFLDADIEEGDIGCHIPIDMEFSYTEALQLPNGITWIDLGSLEEKYQCPRSFREANVYVDSAKVQLEAVDVAEH